MWTDTSPDGGEEQQGRPVCFRLGALRVALQRPLPSLLGPERLSQLPSPLGSFPSIIAIADEQIASRGPDCRRTELSRPVIRYLNRRSGIPAGGAGDRAAGGASRRATCRQEAGGAGDQGAGGASRRAACRQARSRRDQQTGSLSPSKKHTFFFTETLPSLIRLGRVFC